MILHIRHFSMAPCYSTSEYDFFLSNLFCNISSVFVLFSLCERSVSHPHITAGLGEIILVRILIINFLTKAGNQQF